MLPFIDLKAQYKLLEPQIRQRIEQVLEHGNYIMGPEVKELEARLAEFVGTRHVISCSSGTDALLMPLMALGVGPGDAVFTTPFTFIATAEVISLLGATPVFVDIDPVTFNIDPNKLDQALRDFHAPASEHPYPRSAAHDRARLTPKAVIPVDLFGLPCDYGRINAIAARHGVKVIEDAAQGFGGEYRGHKAGSLAWCGCTSFFPAKPLGCYGDGGAIFTDSDELKAQLESIRVHGKGSDKYDNIRVGMNGRLDTIQAAILLPKLAVFAQEVAKRLEVANRYGRGLSDLAPGLRAPSTPEGYLSSWAQYSLLAGNEAARERIMSGLKQAGVPTAVYYPKPLHLQTAYAGLGYRQGDMPVSEDCARRIFSLPMHPYIEAADQERIITAVRALA